MGFRQGSFARVWKAENKGNYSVGQVSVSKKNKETGNYDVEFQNNFVRFVGTAHTLLQQNPIPEGRGLPIKISSCDVTNRWDKEKQKEYTNFVIFGFELADNTSNNNNTNYNNTNKTAKKTEIDESIDDDELPFN